jgi:transcriptional regulator with XRE-family HTH domain
MTTPKHYPNRLREWRLSRQWSLDTVAKKMHSTITTVARHETAMNEMTVAQLYRYAALYGVPIEELLAPRPQPADMTIVAIMRLCHRLDSDGRAQAHRVVSALLPEGKASRH